MKKRLFVLASSAAALAIFPACDQHHWEGSDDGNKPATKHLFEKHGHGGDHGKDKGHAEEKEEA